MRVFLSMITVVAAMGLASGLGAQQKKAAPKTPKPERETCFSTNGKTECTFQYESRLDSALIKRAAIGVQLSPTGTARDTLGVFISRVTPKGPAENAGIVEGDRIVSINGIDLRVNAADAGDSYAAGLPSRRLTREVAKLSPGATVNLRVWSGGRIRDVQVTTGRASDLGEGGFFGLLEGGAPGRVFRTMPLMENMRVPMAQMRSLEGMRVPLEQLRSMEKMRVPMGELRTLEKMREPMERLRMTIPEMRMEGRDFPRMMIEEFQIPKMRIEGLKDGTRVRIYSPNRFGDGEYRTYIIGPDGELKLDKSEAGKKAESAEKARKESIKK